MEYKLISVVGYNEFIDTMDRYFADGWSLLFNVVVTLIIDREKSFSTNEFERYTQWIVRESLVKDSRPILNPKK